MVDPGGTLPAMSNASNALRTPAPSVLPAKMYSPMPLLFSDSGSYMVLSFTGLSVTVAARAGWSGATPSRSSRRSRIGLFVSVHPWRKAVSRRSAELMVFIPPPDSSPTPRQAKSELRKSRAKPARQVRAFPPPIISEMVGV